MERVAAKPKLLEGRLSEYKRPSNLTQRVTAIEDFFVISHMANADVDPAKWRLCIAGLVDIEGIDTLS
jgi:DMSO/TMAO reductase YedYZ molybdopterin-dependent catalytic subunit